jgi:F-type H+-transporting ATPase subunit b
MSDLSFLRILGAETTGATGATGEHAETTEAHTEEHAEHNSFYGNRDELIWGTAAFLILFVLFIWKGVPAVKKAAAARTQRIADEIAAGEANKAAAERELATLKASLGNAAVDAEAILAEARTRTETVKVDLLARVEADVEASKQRTRIEIEASRQQAFADLQAEVAAMTVTATNAVVNENLTDAVKSDLIEQFITQLGATR